MEIRNKPGTCSLTVTLVNGDEYEFEWLEWSSCRVQDGVAAVAKDGDVIAVFSMHNVAKIERGD